MREPLAGLQKLKARGAFEAVRLRCQVLGDLVLRLGDEFGCGGGRGGAQVGGEVGDGEVGFMADGGDDGKLRCGNGARYPLAVEGGQVFERAAAARKNDQVDEIELRSAQQARLQSQQVRIRPARRPEKAAH